MANKAILRPATIDPLQRHTINEATALLRQSRAKTYADIRNNKLKIIKDGARTYIHGSELIRRSAESDIPQIPTARSGVLV
jgi:hypothetical protein